MLKVKGKYFPRTPWGPDLRFPKNYSVFLDTDSIYEDDMPIERSAELIMSAIHIQLRVPYSDFDNSFTVEEILLNIEESRISPIIEKVNDMNFEKHLKNGLNLVGSVNWEDAGNRLGVALEVMIKLLFLKDNKTAPETPLGNLIKAAVKQDVIKNEAFIWEANEARKRSSHNTISGANKNDYSTIFIAIEKLSQTYF